MHNSNAKLLSSSTRNKQTIYHETQINHPEPRLECTCEANPWVVQSVMLIPEQVSFCSTFVIASAWRSHDGAACSTQCADDSKTKANERYSQFSLAAASLARTLHWITRISFTDTLSQHRPPMHFVQSKVMVIGEIYDALKKKKFQIWLDCFYC